MKVAKTLFVLIFVVFGAKRVITEPCTTQENTSGNCIAFHDCDVLRKLLPEARKDERIRDYLKRSQCKVTRLPYVCCPLDASNVHLQEPNPQIRLPKAADGTCGRSFDANGNIPSRIFGGENAHLGEFPWVALLGYKKPGNRIGFQCGSTIITSLHVVTAAHCTTSLPATWMLTKVRIGEFDLETDSDCEEINSVYYCGFPAVDFDVDRIIAHDQYSSHQSGNPHDIAIIKLKQAITFNEFVKPICLPLNKEINTAYGSPTVAGFGRTEVSEMSTKLKKAEVDIVDNRVCASKYQAQSRTIHSSQICAGREDTDACSGDSGGGLFKQSDTGPVWYLIGIVSFGPRKCASEYPGVYVNIKDYIEWIKNKVEERN